MADLKKPIGKDATGYEILTEAMKALLNQYPGLEKGERIKYEELALGWRYFLLRRHRSIDLFGKRGCVRNDASGMPVSISCGVSYGIRQRAAETFYPEIPGQPWQVDMPGASNYKWCRDTLICFPGAFAGAEDKTHHS